MVGLDIWIKIVRKEGVKDWPKQVRRIRNRWNETKLGFPGIGDSDVSFVKFEDIKEGDIFIYDSYAWNGKGDDAPLMLRSVGSAFIVEGIGCGLDSKDPTRTLIKYKDTITMPIPKSAYVWRVNSRPKYGIGGPAYYYFFKAFRDMRY